MRLLCLCLPHTHTPTHPNSAHHPPLTALVHACLTVVFGIYDLNGDEYIAREEMFFLLKHTMVKVGQCLSFLPTPRPPGSRFPLRTSALPMVPYPPPPPHTRSHNQRKTATRASRTLWTLSSKRWCAGHGRTPPPGCPCSGQGSRHSSAPHRPHTGQGSGRQVIHERLHRRRDAGRAAAGSARPLPAKQIRTPGGDGMAARHACSFRCASTHPRTHAPTHAPPPVTSRPQDTKAFLAACADVIPV